VKKDLVINYVKLNTLKTLSRLISGRIKNAPAVVRACR
jgi:hypothetical protein